MAWAKVFDGVNDYASISSPTAMHQILLSYKVRAKIRISTFGADSQIYIYGRSSNFNSYIKVTPTDIQVRYSSTKVTISGIPNLADGLWHTIDVCRAADGTHSVFVDDSKHGNSPVNTIVDASLVDVIGKSSSVVSGFDLESLSLFDSDAGGTELISWDATASNHGAGTPVLVDTVGGNNATGVNMPTDGSAWIDLGGGAENSADIASNMPSLLSSAAFSHVAPVGFNASISSTLPSLTSSANFTQTLTEFDASVSSNMPSLLSAANLTNTAPGYNTAIASVMPSMISASNVTVTTPQSGAAISSTMPSMLSLSNVTVTPPQTGVAISSNMPSLVSSGNFTQALPAAGVVVSSTMPSMVSAAVFNQVVPEFDITTTSTMPSLVSSAAIQNLTPGNNSAIASLMPALTSSATLTIDEPVTLDASINSTMPSMRSAATLYNGIISIVIGEGNNIDIVVKSRNINIQTKSRNI